MFIIRNQNATLLEKYFTDKRHKVEVEDNMSIVYNLSVWKAEELPNGKYRYEPSIAICEDIAYTRPIIIDLTSGEVEITLESTEEVVTTLVSKDEVKNIFTTDLYTKMLNLLGYSSVEVVDNSIVAVSSGVYSTPFDSKSEINIQKYVESNRDTVLHGMRSEVVKFANSMKDSGRAKRVEIDTLTFDGIVLGFDILDETIKGDYFLVMVIKISDTQYRLSVSVDDQKIDVSATEESKSIKENEIPEYINFKLKGLFGSLSFTENNVMPYVEVVGIK